MSSAAPNFVYFEFNFGPRFDLCAFVFCVSVFSCYSCLFFFLCFINRLQDLPRLVLNQVRFLDHIVDSGSLTKKVLEVLGVLPLGLQRDMISYLPEVRVVCIVGVGHRLLLRFIFDPWPCLLSDVTSTVTLFLPRTSVDFPRKRADERQQ